MKVKEFPLMHQFLWGSFTANSGGTKENTAETECLTIIPETGGPDYAVDPVDTQAQWDEAEQWLREFADSLLYDQTPEFKVRFIHRLGMQADDAVTIFVQGSTTMLHEDTDNQVKAPPYALLDLYY